MRSGKYAIAALKLIRLATWSMLQPSRQKLIRRNLLPMQNLSQRTLRDVGLTHAAVTETVDGIIACRRVILRRTVAEIAEDLLCEDETADRDRGLDEVNTCPQLAQCQ